MRGDVGQKADLTRGHDPSGTDPGVEAGHGLWVRAKSYVGALASRSSRKIVASPRIWEQESSVRCHIDIKGGQTLTGPLALAAYSRIFGGSGRYLRV